VQTWNILSGVSFAILIAITVWALFRKDEIAASDQVEESSDPEEAKNARITRIINRTLATILWAAGIALLLYFMSFLGSID